MLLDNKEGITGYQLQEKYLLPRTNVLRILDELLEDDYVTTKELVKDGRAKKKYQLTPKGRNYLENLKAEWALEFSFFSDLAPPEKYSNPFHRPDLYRQMIDEIENLETNEDVLDYFHGYRSFLKNRIKKSTEQLNKLEDLKSEVDTIIDRLSAKDKLQLDELKNLLKKIQSKYSQID
jgi:DNA-binding PadR family transcriptional regulator